MKSKRFLATALLLLISFSAASAAAYPTGERVNLWPKNRIPDYSDKQIAAMTSDVEEPGFKAAKHRMPYIEWLEAPEHPNGACAILISGGSYECCCDMWCIEYWHKVLSAEGVQCVNLVYRTPRPEGLEIYQTAWEDGQRAVRLVRRDAAKRGIDPSRIGTVSMSAGSHLALLLATSSQTPAYARVDAVDDLPCNINFAIVHAPAYATTDGMSGTPASRDGYGPDIKVSPMFKFDSATCPVSLHHGGMDIYSPNGSTLVYREMRKLGVPAELHLYPGVGHGVYGFERGVEFLRQIGILGPVPEEVDIMTRFTDDGRASMVTENIWPEDRMPYSELDQCEPYIEWHFPKELKTKAIQIIYSGGSYEGNGPESFEVQPVRQYLNDLGITVVTMKYRVPRPEGMPKHITAWQDLQRAIRVVRSEAAARGLDPNAIGIMGSSAGGHLTLMGVTSSMHQSYLPIDDIDKLPCNVQWGIGIYPAYALTDGLEEPNLHGGNLDSDILAPEFSFDLATAPMLLIHGDADGWASMNSVKVWEKMRAMGIQCELHTLALRPHCFMWHASPGTGSYTWVDRIAEYILSR